MAEYNHLEIEKKWQDRWVKDGTYRFNVADPRPVYSIDNPPSFTSGTLHMGHVLNHSWIDFIARYKRMRGFNVLFPLGYDCHGLPTELKVAKQFGIDKRERDKFRAKCEEYTTQAIARMNEQYKRIGYSCDWSEYYETRSPEYKKLVQYSLLKFNEMGRIYREKHPVMWCTKCGTALANAEVGHVATKGKLWHLRFNVVGEEGKHVVIATTRPELMFACIGVFVHPDDDRYYGLPGKKVLIPYVNREVQVMSDERVDRAFGTGTVYVCTYGDDMDVAWQKEYNLPVHIAIDENGRMADICGKYKGMTLKQCLAALLADLEKDGYLVKTEDYEHNVLCHTERASCMNPIEFLPMEQWFIKLKEYVDEIRDAIKGYKWHPDFIKVRMEDWINALDWDWVASRQRVYGTPVPFWHCEKCNGIVPATEAQLPVDTMLDKPSSNRCSKCGGKVVGTPDTCDCWVDSSVTPLKISRWRERDDYFKKAYPASLRPQGYEIIRTWAFYTTYRCNALTGTPPFKDLVINGMVAGPDGRKMSKSYGNMVEPEAVLNKEGSDAVRQWALSASLAEDYPFTQKELVHAFKFQKKYWNASQFASIHLEKLSSAPKAKPTRFADKWILNKLDKLIGDATASLDRYEFSQALTPIRTFFWHYFCDNYLEMAKDRLYNAPPVEKLAAQSTLYRVLHDSTLLLAPFIPHVTEEVHETFLKRFTALRSVHLSAWPHADGGYDEALDALGEKVIEVIAAVRKFKSENQLPLNSEIAKVSVYGADLKDAADDLRETLKAKEISFEQGKGNIPVLDFSISVLK
jgi:valyl-tRNA synthetase